MSDADSADDPARVSAILKIHRDFDDGFKKYSEWIAKGIVPDSEVEGLRARGDQLSKLNDRLRDWALEGVSLAEGSTLENILLRVGKDRLVCIDAASFNDDDLGYRNLLVEEYVPAFEELTE